MVVRFLTVCSVIILCVAGCKEPTPKTKTLPFEKVDGNLAQFYMSVYGNDLSAVDRDTLGLNASSGRSTPPPQTFKPLIAYEIRDGEYYVELLIKTDGRYDELEALGSNLSSKLAGRCATICPLSLLPKIAALKSVLEIGPSTPIKNATPR